MYLLVYMCVGRLACLLCHLEHYSAACVLVMPVVMLAPARVASFWRGDMYFSASLCSASAWMPSRSSAMICSPCGGLSTSAARFSCLDDNKPGDKQGSEAPVSRLTSASRRPRPVGI